MAILWRRTIDNTRYEVRSAGKTRRLYTNGVCHSEFNPVQVFTGSIWDLLVLPAWLYPEHSMRRVLVLGVGGGAVLQQLDRLLQAEALVGIERDATHLYLAERFFGARGAGVEYHQAEAGEWLSGYTGEPFDMIIDDLFADERDEPVRAVTVDPAWADLLLRHLHPDGMLAVNFASRQELLASALYAKKTCNRRFASIFQLTTPLLDNHVGVFTARESSSRSLRDRITRNPSIQWALRSRKIRYRIRQLK